MTIFEYKDYKKYTNDRIKKMPKQGHGQYQKLANFLSVHSVNVSQVFHGDRDLNPEQALGVCEFFGLTPLESKYFRTLVDLNRAGTVKLKEALRSELKEVSEKASDLKNRISHQSEISDEVKAVFYSQWYYSAIRNLTSIKNFDNVDRIADYLELPTTLVSRVVDFLVQTGLCKNVEGKIVIGPNSTHVPASHPLVQRHHANWRIKSVSKMENASAEELFFTMPCSLPARAIPEVRKELLAAIDRIILQVDSGAEEQLACLNIDWFKV